MSDRLYVTTIDGDKPYECQFQGYGVYLCGKCGKGKLYLAFLTDCPECGARVTEFPDGVETGPAIPPEGKVSTRVSIERLPHGAKVSVLIQKLRAGEDELPLAQVLSLAHADIGKRLTELQQGLGPVFDMVDAEPDRDALTAAAARVLKLLVSADRVAEQNGTEKVTFSRWLLRQLWKPLADALGWTPQDVGWARESTGLLAEPSAELLARMDRVAREEEPRTQAAFREGQKSARHDKLTTEFARILKQLISAELGWTPADALAAPEPTPTKERARAGLVCQHRRGVPDRRDGKARFLSLRVFEATPLGAIEANEWIGRGEPYHIVEEILDVGIAENGNIVVLAVEVE